MAITGPRAWTVPSKCSAPSLSRATETSPTFKTSPSTSQPSAADVCPEVVAPITVFDLNAPNLAALAAKIGSVSSPAQKLLALAEYALLVETIKNTN
ncbi:hypothetical protein EVAR_18179_1 [Eumeta japonica]|uniref:Uncharacterized protein n=1 Tax=Eumeta variegata TaxID=151549 RepID=A0A4C1UVW7_EUMVA|nr:hypothetical protein EVAR_18179_1 [Eumeta japonica]